MRPFFKNEDFDFETIISLGAVQYGAADIGEVLSTIERIRNGKYDQWVSEWSSTAARVRKAAQKSQSAGHDVSARWAYLRASTYYNSASFLSDHTADPDAFDTWWNEHRDCWDKFVELSPHIEPLSVPFEGIELEGAFFKLDDSDEPRPTIILNNGSDGSIAQMWTCGAAAAIQRGWNAMTFDGPGQGAALHRQKIYFRPNWETVITPVVDVILDRADVDPDKLVLHGISQAGFWVPRALAYEHRFAAGVADPGVHNMAEVWLNHLPHSMVKQLEAGDRDGFNKKMRFTERLSKNTAAMMKTRSRPFGTDNDYDTFKAAEDYVLTQQQIASISCPMLITDPEGESFWPGQSRELHEMLDVTDKELVSFTEEEGGDLHCEPAALALRDQRVFDWLDATVRDS